MTTATLKQELTTEAETKRAAALKAHKAGDFGLRDAFLRQAADRYQATGQDGMALWCKRFIGS